MDIPGLIFAITVTFLIFYKLVPDVLMRWWNGIRTLYTHISHMHITHLTNITSTHNDNITPPPSYHARDTEILARANTLFMQQLHMHSHMDVQNDTPTPTPPPPIVTALHENTHDTRTNTQRLYDAMQECTSCSDNEIIRMSGIPRTTAQRILKRLRASSVQSQADRIVEQAWK
jgi:hypothetical protein